MIMPDDVRVTPRVPAPLAFTLRLLLVIAVAALVVLIAWTALGLDGAYVRWQATR